MKRLIKLLIGVIIPLSAVAAPDIKPGEVLRAEQFYRGVINSQPPTLDVGLSYDSTSAVILNSLFDTLVREDVNGKIIPSAAESWDISPDGKRYTFHLRKDAKWSNGEPVKAGDYVYAWQRVVDPNSVSHGQAYFTPLYVVNAKEIVEGKISPERLGVRAVDDYTFEVNLTQAVPWFIPALTYVITAAVYKPAVERYGIEWTKPENIVTNGPFLLEELKVNEKIVLKKNPQYWDADRIVITGAQYNIVSDALQNYRSFKAGEIDQAGVPKTVFEEAKNSGLMISVEGFLVTGYAFNVQRIKDVNVRKAIVLALDSKLIVEKVVRNNQRYAKSWTPNYITEAEDIKPMEVLTIPQAERNRQAQKLLKEAGYTKENPFRITLTTPSTNNADVKQQLVAVQNVVNTNTGGLVKLTLDSIEWKVFLENKRNGELEFLHAGWGADFNHASNFLSYWLPNNKANAALIDDEEYNKLFNEANNSRDSGKRAKLYAEAERRMTDVNYAVIPLIESVNNFVVQPYLRGVTTKAMTGYLQDRYYIDIEKSKKQ